MKSTFTVLLSFFFFNDTATTEIYTLSLHDARRSRRVPLLEARLLRQRDAHSGGRRPVPRAALVPLMRRALSPLWLALEGLALLVVAFLVLWLVPSNSYIFLPDRAHAVDPLVQVQGGHKQRGGGIYFVDIFVRKASLIERIWPGIHEGAELVPSSAILAPGVSNRERVAADQREMTRSQQIAGAVALRAAGFRVRAIPTGALVQQVAGGAPAAGKLLPTDVIVAAGHRRVRSPADLRAIVGRRRPGDTIELSVRRGSQLMKVVVRTVADPQQRGRSIIGIFVDQATFIKLPRRVEINAGSVGGP